MFIKGYTSLCNQKYSKISKIDTSLSTKCYPMFNKGDTSLL